MDAFADGHIGIGRPMQQQQWSVDFVGMKERTLLHIELGIVPRIASCTGSRAVGISPIALSPVAGDVADTCMRNGGRKEVGAGKQVLRHEAAVGSADVPDFCSVDKRVGVHEFFYPFDDFVGGLFSPCINVASRKFLTVAGCSARLQRINHIILSSIDV